MDEPDNPPCSSRPISLVQQMIAASSGAILTSLTMTPMDVIKIRLQQQAHPFVKGTCFLYHNGLMDHLCTACADINGKQPCEWFARPGNFTGTMDAFVKITRTEGVTSLWSGLSPTLVMAVPATVFYYAVYDNLLFWLRHRGQHEAWWLPMCAGAGARTMASTFVSPLEMIRTKMQSERLTYYEIGVAVKRAKLADGWRSLYRGWAPTLMRDLPFSGAQFPFWLSAGYIFEYPTAAAVLRLQKPETTFSTSFFCGAVSGTIAAFVTTPFDVAKTQRQITIGETADHTHAHNHVTNGQAARIQATSTFGILKEILHRRGFRALFAGVVPRIVKVSPACAIMIGIYEQAKAYFSNINRRKLENR